MSITCVGIIQCRLNSTRLPGKALLPLAGRPMLEWTIRRALRAGTLDRVVLATTDLPGDDAVAELGRGLGLEVVRGHADNLLARFALVLERHPAPMAVRITGDNPLTDSEAVDRVVSRFRELGLDYAYASGLPYGMGADAFSTPALLHLARHADSPRHQEHINTFFLDHHLRFSIGCAPAWEGAFGPQARVTVDTREDLERMERLFALLDDPVTATAGQVIEACTRLTDWPSDPAAQVALAIQRRR